MASAFRLEAGSSGVTRSCLASFFLFPFLLSSPASPQGRLAGRLRTALPFEREALPTALFILLFFLQKTGPID
jgi:hypothetical protein